MPDTLTSSTAETAESDAAVAPDARSAVVQSPVLGVEAISPARRARASRSRRRWSGLLAALVALSRRPALSTAIVFAAAFSGPFVFREHPTTFKPAIHDEFAYLLGAETFLHGRLTNPPHPLERYLQSFHVLQRPTYQSKYPPANSLFIAAGWKLGGSPGVGVVFSYAFMCACIAWMLRAYVGRLLGFSLGLAFAIGMADSPWATTFWGGAVAAGAGALVLGACARMLRVGSVSTARGLTRNAIVLAVGLLLLANSRPFEGLFLAAPALIVLAADLWRRRHEARPTALRRAIASFVVVMTLGGAWMLGYNHAVTGSWREMPYKAYTRLNASVPLFVTETVPSSAARVDPADPTVSVNTIEQRRTFTLHGFAVYGYFLATLIAFLVPAAALLPFGLLPFGLRDRLTRVALVAVGGTVVGMALTLWHFFHYAAPATAAILAVYGACLHMLGKLRLGTRRVGRPLVAGSLLAFALTVPWHMALQAAKGPKTPGWPEHRQIIADSLGRKGKSVVFVRYAPTHPTADEWVYNAADIDGSPVVWAHDFGPHGNAELLRYYHDRKAWIVDVNQETGPFPVAPYSTLGATGR